MSDLQVSNTFSAGVIDATKFNTNYSDIATYVNNRNSGAATWDAMFSSHATNIPLTANNSTGTQDILNFKDDGTTAFSLADGGIWTTALQSGSRITGSQVFGSGAETQVVLSSVDYDIKSEFNTSIYRCTILKSGKYFVSCSVLSTVIFSNGDVLELRLKKNGSIISIFKYEKVTGTSGSFSGQISDIVNLASGDYLELFLLNGAISLSITSGSTFSINKVA